MEKVQPQPIKLTGKYFYALGRRKRAIAKARLYNGKGNFYINGKEIAKPSLVYLEPLDMVGKKTAFDVMAWVCGGGIASQSMAIRHAISRALLEYNKDFRQTLKKAGFLTRDPREKERKKPGLKRARKAPQWCKR